MICGDLLMQYDHNVTFIALGCVHAVKIGLAPIGMKEKPGGSPQNTGVSLVTLNGIRNEKHEQSSHGCDGFFVVRSQKFVLTFGNSKGGICATADELHGTRRTGASRLARPTHSPLATCTMRDCFGTDLSKRKTCDRSLRSHAVCITRLPRPAKHVANAAVSE